MIRDEAHPGIASPLGNFRHERGFHGHLQKRLAGLFVPHDGALRGEDPPLCSDLLERGDVSVVASRRHGDLDPGLAEAIEGREIFHADLLVRSEEGVIQVDKSQWMGEAVFHAMGFLRILRDGRIFARAPVAKIVLEAIT